MRASLAKLAEEQAPKASGPLPGEGEDAGKTVIYRDTWGVAHIYAPTIEAGLYAQGYAIAEDRPELLLTNFMTAIGELASIKGKDAIQSDLRSHMWDHYGMAKALADRNRPEIRSHLQAFAAGINEFYAQHPKDAPEWWGGRRVDEAMIVAFGRLFLFNWSIDEAYGDLERGGIKPGFDPVQRGSNQWAVSPARSASKNALLLIDPHLSWWGPSRFWEFRIHAGGLQGSGVTLAGSPYIGLGHNANLAWAMTTGGPDTADIYELTLNETDPTQYLYEGEWKKMTSRDVTLAVKGEEPQTHTLWFSQHGPIIAKHGTKAYAAKMAYDDVVNGSEVWYDLNLAKDYTGAVTAIDTLAIFPQNVMCADTSGNIYYQRAGRVPKRSQDLDWSVPVDGSKAAAEWQGFHPGSDLLHVLNPPQGYMQNCNIPPDAMMPNSPFKLSESIDYIFASKDYGDNRDGWTNQRGARAIQLLGADDSVTVEEALQYAVDMRIYGADRWVEVLRQAHAKYAADYAGNSDYQPAIDDLLAWDLESRPESTGALKYYYWRKQLADDFGDMVKEAEKSIDDWYAIVEGRPERALQEPDEALQTGLAEFVKAMGVLKEHFGKLDATYGDKFRVGRGDASWPVGGGGDVGNRTLRSMTYEKDRDDHTRWGTGGQTSTQLVQLSKPVESWMYLPVGNSDRTDSSHYRDQAEKAFSKAQLKDTWWRPEELKDHIESRTVLANAPA